MKKLSRRISLTLLIIGILLVLSDCGGGHSTSVSVGVGVGVHPGFGHPYGYGRGWGYPPGYYPGRPMGPRW